MLLLIGASGCKTAPVRHAEDAGAEIPSHWTGANGSSQPTPEHWVESFGDPDLSSLIHSGLADNYDLKAAATRLDAAIAQARIDGSGLFPQISFNPDHQQVQIREQDLARQGLRYSKPYSASVGSWMYGDASGTSGRQPSGADAIASDLHGARLSLAARIAQSYFDLAEARLQSEVAEQSVKDRRTIVQLVRGRFARGITNALDLRLALTDLATAESELTRLAIRFR